MTNLLTQKEIARIFALYIGAPCAIYDYSNEPDRWDPAYIEGVDINAQKPIIAERTNWPLDKVKLILVPMELLNNTNSSIYRNNIDEIVKRIGTMQHSIMMGNYLTQLSFLRFYEICLYFGPDHPATDCTPLELGIAIPDRSYLFELISICYPNEDFHKSFSEVLDYAKELGHNIDTKAGMLKMIKVMEDIQLLNKRAKK